MKKWRCILIALVLVLLPYQMVSATNNNMPDIESANLNTVNAKLQVEMTQVTKQHLMDQMDQISALQEEQKQISQYLSEARMLQEEAKTLDDSTKMPQELEEYMVANGLVYEDSGDDQVLLEDEWNLVISLLEARLEEIGIQVHTLMIYVQDIMRQYNSNLNGTNTQNTNSSQTISSIARGQSMYGDSSAGLLLTTLVIGVVLGCLLTIAVEKTMKKG